MAKRRQVRRKVPATRKPAAASPDLKKQNADLRGELTEARAQQAATAEVLKVISRSTFDLQAVLETLVESAARLCEADQAAISQQKGSVFWAVANYGHAADVWQSMQSQPLEITRATLPGRVIIDGGVVHIHDVFAEPEFRGFAKRIGTGTRTALAVPLLREGTPIGVLVLLRRSVKPFTDKQIELVETFADQAVIAIENARLFDEVQARTKELTESLEQQTATSEVLGVISGSPGDLQPVFETLLANATRLCEARFGVLNLYDGELFRYVAMHNVPPAFAELRKREPFRFPPTSAHARVVATKEVVHFVDAKEDDPGYVARDPFVVAAVELGGVRTLVVVPMLKENELIGAITIYRQEVRPFTDKQIELVVNFAKQAVIAIENVRLLSELRESLQQQTATSEVLEVISSSPGEIQPVFQSMLENATRVCAAEFGTLVLCENGGLRRGAFYNAPAAFMEIVQRDPIFYPHADEPVGRMLRTKQQVHVADMRDEPVYRAGAPPIRALVDLAGARSFLTVPMLKEGEVVGAIGIYRQEVRPFSDKQINLLTNFASQAVIAIENVRLLNELRESLAQQTATSEVLQVISSSPGKLAPVFETMLEKATRVCDAKFGNLMLWEGDAFRNVAVHAARPAFAEKIRSLIYRHVHPDGPLGRAMSTKQAVHVADLKAERPYLEGNPPIVDLVDVGGARTLAAVPMLKENELIGAIIIYREEVRSFTDKQIALVANFAAQAVIAIENVRLLNELRESLEQQTATSEVLSVISSSPGELEPVFQSMLENALRICEAKFGVMFRSDQGQFKMAAMLDLPPPFAEFLQRDGGILSPPTPGTVLDRVLQTKKVAHVADGAAIQFPSPAAKLGGARSTVAVPMLKDDELVGAFVIYRQEVRPFTDKQIELVANFAAQAVIAIENVRLLNELRESLEQQTATSEVLQVISSSPGELEPVFTAMLEKATSICEAKFGNLMLREGDAFRAVAVHGEPTYVETWRREPLISTRDKFMPLARLMRTQEVVHISDSTTDQAYVEHHPRMVALVDAGGIRTFLAVPMLKEDELIGAIVMYRQEVRPFTDKQIGLVQSFANQAVIAIENVRLLNELRARTADLGRSVEELRALGDVSQAVNSTLDLATVLSTIVSRAVQLSGTEAGTIYEFEEHQKELQLRSTYGMSEEIIAALREQHLGVGEPTIDRAVTRREPVQIEDLAASPPTPARDIVARAGFRALLVVPLLAPERVVGALVVRRKAPGVFPENTVDLLKTFAAQSVLAIQNAHLFTEIDEKSRQLAIASQHKSQFLANMSHELRTPLNAILGYTELILDNIYGETPDKMREVLERLHANGKHLLGLINDVLDLSKIEAGQLTLDLADYSLKDVVHTVVTAVESLAAGKKLSLTTVVALNLPVGHGDERRLVQVLLNLVGNAIKFTDKGEVAVEATTSDGSFTVAVRDTGPGISPSDQVKIFEEFQQADNAAAKRKGGTGLGLSIAKRIIAMHGGRIWVESDVGKGSTFAFTIPVTVERQVNEP